MNSKAQTPEDIKLIVGLGNPGEAYEKTYHNAGMLAVNRLARLLRAQTPKKQGAFIYRKAGAHIFVTPQTFMNESGLAVSRALKFFKLAPETLLVVHDESDLPLGAAKLEFGRGDAGHRGIASIVESLHTKDFWRLRIGIRHGEEKAGDFVLRLLPPDHEDRLYLAFEGAIKNVITNANP